jgi:hypothetical protein
MLFFRREFHIFLYLTCMDNFIITYLSNHFRIDASKITPLIDKYHNKANKLQ